MRTGLKEPIGYDLALSRALTVMVVLCGMVITCFSSGGVVVVSFVFLIFDFFDFCS
jgi:hypothetical protein